MKRVYSVFLTCFTCLFILVLAYSGAYACGDTDPGGAGAIKLQGYSFVEDPGLAEALAPGIAACSCAEVLTVLLEYDFEIANVSGIQGPPGVVYTLVRGKPDFSSGTPPVPPVFGVAVVKCGKAGPCSGSDDGGCSDSGGTGGCETTP